MSGFAIITLQNSKFQIQMDLGFIFYGSSGINGSRRSS